MKIKICGLFRDEDVEYVNEAGPDYAGFVFAGGRRGVDFGTARRLRQALAAEIEPVGVFVNAPIDEVAALYADGVIGLAQLHGSEDEAYIERLKECCGVPVIKTVLCSTPPVVPALGETAADFLLFDSGSGSGRAFDWSLLDFARPPSNCPQPRMPDALSLSKAGVEGTGGLRWFLAGGINRDNIAAAAALGPFCIDVSSGAESDGLKDRAKIKELVEMVRNR